MEAIISAHLKYGKQGCLKKVIIPFYDDSNSPKQLIDGLIAKGYPSDLIDIKQY